jgi:hypothetical protein
VVSPAAAYDHPEAVNLTLFGERIETHVYGEMPPPEANPRPDMYIAVILIADSGSAARYAMEHTSYENEYHEQFDRWCATSGYSAPCMRCYGRRGGEVR